MPKSLPDVRPLKRVPHRKLGTVYLERFKADHETAALGLARQAVFVVPDGLTFHRLEVQRSERGRRCSVTVVWRAAGSPEETDGPSASP